MESLRIPPWSSRVFSDNYRGLSCLKLKEAVGGHEIHFPVSPKHFRVVYPHPVSSLKIRCTFVSSAIYSSSDDQKHLKSEDTQIQDASKTIRVKFQLQKECAFGERFHIVGNDPSLGSWDPSRAIPLDWSDGHIWTAELVIHVGKSIEYKFILKGSTGHILWQPGPDRILRTWDTDNIILVSEDWENPQLQMLIEEDPKSNGEPESTIDSEILLIAESSAATPTDVTFSNPTMTRLQEKHMNDLSEQDTSVGGSGFGNNGRAVTSQSFVGIKDAEKLGSYQDDPVLVPGLTPLMTLDAEEACLAEVNKKSLANNASLGAEKPTKHVMEATATTERDKSTAFFISWFKFRTIDASCLHPFRFSALTGTTQQLDFERDPTNGSSLSKDPPVMLTDVLEEKQQLAKEQEPHNFKLFEEVIDNDIQWGRRTLQNFFASLGFFHD